MSFIDWAPAYDIGVNAMNDEHKGIMDRMNKLYELHTKGASTIEIAPVLEDFGAFTTKHFQDEEKYMESIQFPELSVHKQIHLNLLNTFKDHSTKFKDEGKLSDAFFVFLKTWLVAHIQGIDMKYGKFSKKAA